VNNLTGNIWFWGMDQTQSFFESFRTKVYSVVMGKLATQNAVVYDSDESGTLRKSVHVFSRKKKVEQNQSNHSENK